MDALTAHVELRLATQRRHALFLDTPAARAHVVKMLAEVHESDGAIVEVLEDPVGPAAVLCWAHRKESFFGVPIDRLMVDHAPNVAVRPWLDSVLARELPRMTSSIDAMIDVHYPDVLRALSDAGLGFDSVQLLGSPREALARLGPVSVDGLELRLLAEADVERTVEFERALFRREPEWCFFGANAGFVETRREALRASLQNPLAVERSVFLDGTYIGHASASAREHAFFGCMAGMTFALHPEARGRGLARGMYRHLLEAAAGRGARVFTGGTCQPPVLHLAKVMGRTARAWLMRRDVPFTATHFGPYAPDL